MITVLLHYIDRESRIIQVYAATKLMDLAYMHFAESAEILGYAP